MSGGKLAGKRAVITGSSRGIGRAVALNFAVEGARVVINGRAPDAVGEVVDRIREHGGTAIAAAGSAADFDVAGGLIDACVGEFGGIDVLVNCAGTAEPPGSSILDMQFADWQALLGSHLGSVFNTCRHAAPRMCAQGSGSIINTSSHAFLGRYGGSGYPAAKGGVNSLSFALAAELSQHGVRVNAVCPGARTRISSGPDYEAKIRDLHARGILDDVARDAALTPPDPEYVAPLYTLLASDLSSSISGELFSVSGGYVGRFRRAREDMIGFRDPVAAGAWDLEALASKLTESPS